MASLSEWGELLGFLGTALALAVLFLALPRGRGYTVWFVLGEALLVLGIIFQIINLVQQGAR